MSMRCCRDTPRCGDCPVRLKAARLAASMAPPGVPCPTARRLAEPTVAVLVAEVLSGTGPRGLPACVADALAQLDEARERRPVPAGI